MFFFLEKKSRRKKLRETPGSLTLQNIPLSVDRNLFPAMRVPNLKACGIQGRPPPKKMSIYFLLIFFFRKISKLKKNVGPVIIKDMQTPPPLEVVENL